MNTHKISIYLYRMAKDAVIPSDFDKIHSKYKTPYFSIIFLVIITITLMYYRRNRIKKHYLLYAI